MTLFKDEDLFVSPGQEVSSDETVVPGADDNSVLNGFSHYFYQMVIMN
jgi:hypothetical protein